MAIPTFTTECTEYRKSVLHLLKFRFAVYLSSNQYRLAVNFGALSINTSHNNYFLGYCVRKTLVHAIMQHKNKDKNKTHYLE